MDSIQISQAARDIPNYIGTYSIDTIPSMKTHPPFHFIVNNQTKNLPGQHWIAVSVYKNNTAYIYDSYGLPPPMLLVQKLKKSMGINKIGYSKEQHQVTGSSNCGLLALKHLKKFVNFS